MGNVDPDWQSVMSDWHFAFSVPEVTGKVKQDPADFTVVEQIHTRPCGAGEHVWLEVRKTKQNTVSVARALAKFAGVAYRDVGYSGLKDYFAVTEQWFSVWLPKASGPDWGDFDLTGVQILHVDRHQRKIKRGTHRANRFRIEIGQLLGDLETLPGKLEMIQSAGVPNYFGSQRFGRNADNMRQALELFSGRSKVKDRQHRGILFSAARAWLFNTVLSARVAEGNWATLNAGEPVNLDGSGSVFRAEGTAAEQDRLRQLDIHPTAPMWGRFTDAEVNPFIGLHRTEEKLIEPYKQLAQGLQQAGLDYQRRATRLRVLDLDWQLEDNCLTLQFELAKGQFATSVLRELVTF